MNKLKVALVTACIVGSLGATLLLTLPIMAVVVGAFVIVGLAVLSWTRDQRPIKPGRYDRPFL